MMNPELWSRWTRFWAWVFEFIWLTILVVLLLVAAVVIVWAQGRKRGVW